MSQIGERMSQIFKMQTKSNKRKKNYDNKKHAKEVKVAGDIMGAWQVRGRCFN